MKSKKGFTLIELLAVIVILAVLATAAFTLVIPQIEKARKKSFISEAASIIDSAEIYFTQNPAETCVKIETLGNTYIKNYDDSKKGIVQYSSSAGFSINFTNGTWKTNGTKKINELKQPNGDPNDSNVIKGNTAATSC